MIRIGTCSWTEKTLIQSGEFYPKQVRTAESRLGYYAGNFDTVEVDSSYYAIPAKSNTYLWADRTPENFIFHIKAYGALTGHAIDTKTLPRDIQDILPGKDKQQPRVYIKEPSILRAIADSFKESLTPLMNKGKLGILVFQFPPWIEYKKQNMEYILSCQNAMGRMPIAVEFRHGSWLTDENQDALFHFLRKHQITYVAADEPQYGSLATVPFIPHLTTDTAYFRFHGRNKQNWLKKRIDTSLRFDYHYSDEELKEFLPAVKRIGSMAKVVYAMFNNCHGGFAMRNALKMKEMVKESMN
jgi:uncharacterized protein YecE (DUF72 family)